MKFKVTGASGQQLAEQIMFTAWQACGGPLGMGVLQDRGPGMTLAQVMANVRSAGDYPGGPMGRDKPGELYGDYVFGRMMKTRVRYTDDTVELGGRGKPEPSYQAWARQYRTYEALVAAAALAIVLADPSMPRVTVELLPEDGG